MADTAQPKPMDAHTHDSATRRDFLQIAATALAGIGAAVACWPLIDSMNAATDTLAAGAPLDVDLTQVAPGQQIIVLWRSRPIFIVNRTAPELKKLQDPQQLSRLRDPNSEQDQQPDYAKNWHRSIKPEYSILVGICTHLGCIPDFTPEPGGMLGPSWPGGYFCPCHGSRYDLAGRVFQGVPAPYNLPVPPYHFTSNTSIRIGENPPGSTFTLSSVEQL
jgi:ubiquinol-cytochrome c reductase iron-sulfur subunit